MNASTEVLIVGAGPCGLTAAAFLAHYGVKVRIIDKKSQQTSTSNAIGIQARTLELFEEIGVSSVMTERSLCCSKVNVLKNSNHLGYFDFGCVDTDYPFICGIPQNETETILIDYLKSKNVNVEYGTELISFEKTQLGVITQIKGQNGTIQVDYPWMIAADGYHSQIRENCKIDFVGGDFNYHFIMIDAKIKNGDFPAKELVLASNDQISMFAFPMQESCRFIAEVSRSSYKNSEPSAAVFTALTNQLSPYTITLDQPSWKSNFYVHERLAKQYISDHVLLLGDAAHVHIPAGAQGMNMGMQDAINLSWKLSRVIQKLSPSNILETYEHERRIVAEKVIKMTTMMSKSVLKPSGLTKCLEKYVAPLLLKTKYFQTIITKKISQTNISYQSSSIVRGMPIGDFIPGKRITHLPLDSLGNHYLVLDFESVIPSNWSNKPGITILNGEILGSFFSDVISGFCVIRPDRYVGFVGDDLRALEYYLDGKELFK